LCFTPGVRFFYLLGKRHYPSARADPQTPESTHIFPIRIGLEYVVVSPQSKIFFHPPRRQSLMYDVGLTVRVPLPSFAWAPQCSILDAVVYVANLPSLGGHLPMGGLVYFSPLPDGCSHSSFQTTVCLRFPPFNPQLFLPKAGDSPQSISPMPASTDFLGRRYASHLCSPGNTVAYEPDDTNTRFSAFGVGGSQ